MQTLVFHRHRSILIAALLIPMLVVRAMAANLMIIGDSLSKEYAYEFLGIGGNASAAHVRNWCEILHERRNSEFSFGSSGIFADWRLTGHEYNWSIPGAFASEWRSRISNGSVALDDLGSQLTGGEVDRVVIWLGGNDIRSRYGDFYDGGSTTAWVNQVASDIEYVLNFVLTKNPTVQVVLVPVPHVGCTPSKSEAHPYNATKTGRITTALDALNGRLQKTASQRGVGWADTYAITKELLTANQWSIGGYIVEKRTSSGGDPDALFLGDGFHPNWPIQAVFAQRILDAFNERYKSRLPRLTNREIVANVLEEDADLSLGSWAGSYGIATSDRGSADDPDGDGVKNLVEFALDLDPSREDISLLPKPYVATLNSLDYLSLTWQPRDLSNNTYVRITPQESSLLSGWTDIPTASIAQGANGQRTVRKLLKSAPRIFLRLKIDKL